MPIIAVGHPKGGAGKTTSTVHLAGEIKPKEAVDLDIHMGLSVIHGLRQENNQMTVHRPTTAQELVDVLQKFKGSDEFLFVDCGGFDSDMTRTAVAFADLLLVPAKDSLTERIGLMKFDQVLAEISEIMETNIVGHVFLCKTNPTKKHFPKMEALLPNLKHLKLMNSRLSSRPQDFEESLESGYGITESLHGRSTPGGKEVIAMVEEIRAMLAMNK